MLSFAQKKSVIDDFKQRGYEVLQVSDNIIDVSRGKDGFYLQLLFEEEIKILRFIIKSDDFSFEFNDYFPLLKLYAKFQPSYEIKLEYQYPFMGADLNVELFKIMPVTSIVGDLLSQTPISTELLREILKITKEIDQRE